MRERVHLLNGTFSIESETNLGTKVMARVPLQTEGAASEARAAAG